MITKIFILVTSMNANFALPHHNGGNKKVPENLEFLILCG